MTYSAKSDKSRWPLRLISILLSVIVSGLSVWLIARDINAEQFAQAARTADLGWITIGAAAIVATLFMRTWRWAALLRPIVVRSSTVMTALLVGQVLNFVLPVRLGDVARSIMLGRGSTAGVERAVGSVAIEKAWDWIALTLLVRIVAITTPLPEWFIDPARAIGLVAAIMLVVLACVAFGPPARSRRLSRLSEWLGGRLPLRWRRPMRERLRRLLDSLTALRRPDALAGAAVWTCLTWGCGVIANYLVMRAFGVDAWPAALLLMAVLMVGVALPPSIAAVGVFEGLTILTLRVVNVPAETALAIGLTLHLVIFVPPLIGAALLSVLTLSAGRTPAVPAECQTSESLSSMKPR
jgi:uncharacterized protein (TIRG00374 family)